MPLDYASIMAAGQNLVPDLRAQMLQDEQARYMADVRKSQAQTNQIALLQKQQAMVREQQFQADLAAATESGKPGAVHQLMIKYPEFADKLKPGWEAQDEATRQRNLTQMGTIYMRAQNGDYAGAASALEARINADKAAGLDTAEDEQILTALKSGDATQQKVALGAIGMSMAAANPDKFGETYGKLFPADRQSPFAKEYQDRVAIFGKEEADKWAALQDTKIGPAGGVVVTADNLPSYLGGGASTQAGGGEPSPSIPANGSAIEKAVMTAVPGVNVTSRQRSPAHNKAVGGVTNSFHLTDQARDFTPPAGLSMASLHAKLKAALPGFDVINEGDHVHVEPSSRAQGPVQVRSKQEYDRLPVGAEYIAPDGSHRRKS